MDKEEMIEGEELCEFMARRLKEQSTVDELCSALACYMVVMSQATAYLDSLTERGFVDFAWGAREIVDEYIKEMQESKS